jgi:hypothetical protein
MVCFSSYYYCKDFGNKFPENEIFEYFGIIFTRTASADTHSVFDTRTPMKLVFSGEQRGKSLYFAMRWENNMGEKGLWNDIISTIIP